MTKDIRRKNDFFLYEISTGRLTVKKRRRFLFRELSSIGRVNTGNGSRENTNFFEKPLHNSLYLLRVHSLPIAVRRENSYFSALVISGGAGSELKRFTGKWSHNFLLYDVFVRKFYYRYWSAKQAFSLKFMEQNKAQFFKYFKKFKNFFASRDRNKLRRKYFSPFFSADYNSKWYKPKWYNSKGYKSDYKSHYRSHYKRDAQLTFKFRIYRAD